MQLDFSLDARGDRLLREDVGEIVSDFVRINLFYLTSRKFDKALQTGYISLTAGNSDQVDKNTAVLCQFSYFLIES